MQECDRGFSLLELMTAVTVVGLLAALSVSSFASFSERQKSQTALKEIQMQVAKARQLAITRNQPVRITTASVTVGGKTYTAVRWEALPCGDAYGTNCPTAACVANACGVGGCVCNTVTGGEVGPSGPAVPGILVTPGLLTLPAALNGLCFQGGSGTPVLRSGGVDCQGGGPVITPTSFLFTLKNQTLPAYLQIDVTTGLPKLADCSTYPATATCP